MSSVLESARPSDYLTRLAVSTFGRSYKALVVDELACRPGDVVVDLGCGPGADLPALAAAVGPAGTVLGIDEDPVAVEEARRATADLAQVSVDQGDGHRLALEDRSVDRVHTDRVLQHVAGPSAVVAEVARVLRADGIAGLAEPDWDTLVIDHPDPARPDAYRRFVTDEVVRNSRIGRRLPALCELAGLRVNRVVPVTAVFRDVAEADRVLGFQRVTERAVDAGYLTPTDAVAWLEHLRSAPFFALATIFVTVAQRA
ncbi:MAG TPA: methyltransferase domain-containing protein [Lapillicoccus sp.]|nr:methyltransferase domain-containing protein [Lapillicoccus sp.]